MDSQKEILLIKSEIYQIIREHYPKNTRREITNLHTTIAFAILTHLYFGGIYKHAYKVSIGEINLFPEI